jgi:glycosyltransferase involved in cell wall biosynthesis
VKICFLIRSLDIGGAQRQLVNLALGLDRRGHDVAVLTMYPDGEFAEILKAANVRVQSLNKRGRYDLIGFQYRLVDHLRRERPDILHSYLDAPNVFAGLARILMFKPPKIVWGLRVSSMPVSAYGKLGRMVRALEAMMSGQADLVIANSAAGRRHLIEKGYRSRDCVVIANGVDSRLFRIDPAARASTRLRWGVSDSDRVVALVGRFDPMKDHATFLRAMSLLRRRRDDLRVVIAGSGPREMKTEIRRNASELGLEDILIWQRETTADVVGIYNGIDLLCMTSSYGEGFPNVVAEAMLCGTPCIVCPTGDVEKIVGPFGRIVPAEDVHRLTDACDEALSDPNSASRAHSGRQHVAKSYSIERLVDVTEGVLCSLVAAPHSNEKHAIEVPDLLHGHTATDSRPPSD